MSLLRLHWETVAVLAMGVALKALAVVLMVRGVIMGLWPGGHQRLPG